MDVDNDELKLILPKYGDQLDLIDFTKKQSTKASKINTKKVYIYYFLLNYSFLNRHQNTLFFLTAEFLYKF